MIYHRWLLISLSFVALVVGSLAWDSWRSNPVGQWLDRAGDPVPDPRLEVWTGSEHCGTSSTTFMALSWPLDVRAGEASRMTSYVWHPSEDMSPTAVTSEIVDAMPPDATNTGFHRGHLTLWVSDSYLRKAVFVMDGVEIQRWAFAPGAGFCF